MNCVKRFLIAAFFGVVALADSQAPAGDVAHPKAAAVAVEYGLDPRLGALPTENLQFKTNTKYLLDQNKAVEARFQKLRGMGPRTNYLEEFSRTVEAVLNSDASERIKEDTRKITLLELAYQRELAAEKDQTGGHLERALQLLAEYVERYSRDAAVPEVLLRQGYLLRRLDLKDEAIEKFYLVLRSVPRIDGRNIAYSRRLVMMAQSAIADTCAEMGRHTEAAELYGRMLQTKSEELEVETVRIKQLRSLRESAPDGILERQAMGFLDDFPDSDYIPEARYFLAHSLKQQKKRDAALEQFQLLLEAVELAPPDRLKRWMPWKLRVGNELANQFYLEGDYLSSLSLYRALARSNAEGQTRQAFQYQVGLCEERLGQVEEAIKTYQQIVEAPTTSSGGSNTNANANAVPVQILRNMATLRISVLRTASRKDPVPRIPGAQP
jgi:TolA-binding protein